MVIVAFVLRGIEWLVRIDIQLHSRGTAHTTAITVGTFTAGIITVV
jgi:hypothetical protein